jgi:hypothetical protein
MDPLDLIVSLLVRWLMPHAPLILRAYARGFWVDGLWTGAAIGVPAGGALAYVGLIIARLILWLVRERD